MIYYILLLFVIILGINFKHIRIRCYEKRTDGQAIYVIIIGAVLILLCGLRHDGIGRDTEMYRYIYENMAHLRWGEYWKEYDYGYYFLQFLISRFFGYRIFLFITAILSIAPVVFIIYKYSKNKIISFILYICFTYYTFCFSALRQAVAIGFIMLAYHQIRKKNLKVFLICTLTAILFHSSALMFLPIYLIDKIPYKKVTIVISCILMIMFYLFRDQFWSVATLFARQQYKAGIDAGGQKMYLFMILSVILGFMYRDGFTGKKSENRLLLYMQIFSVLIWPMATVNPAIARMYYYFHIFFILYVPELLYAIRERGERFFILTGYMCVAFYFLIDQIFAPLMKCNPYLFFWQS